MAGDEVFAFFQQDIIQETHILYELLARSQQFAAMQAGIDPAQVAAATAIAKDYPTAPGSVVAPLGMMMANPQDPAVAGVMQMVEEDNDSFVDKLGSALGSAFGWTAKQLEKVVADPIQDIARGTLLAFDTAWNEVIARPYRTLVGTLQKAGIDPGTLHSMPITWDESDFEGFSWGRLGDAIGDIGSTYQDAGASAGVLAAQKLLKGEWDDINLGTGILPMSEMAEETAEYEQLIKGGADPEQARRTIQDSLGAPLTSLADQQRETGIQYKGLSVTPGRVTASQYLDVETEPFKLLSGLIDAGINMYADPAYLALKGSSAVRNAQHTFNGAVMGRVIGPSADSWINSTGRTGGQRVVTRVGEIDNIPDMQKLLPEVTDRTLLADLVEATDNAAITKRLRDEIVTNRNIRQVPHDRRIRNGIRSRGEGTRLGKLLNDQPGYELDIDNLDVGLQAFDDFLVAAETPRAVRNDLTYKLARVADGDHVGALDVYKQAMQEFGPRMMDELPERLKKFAQTQDLDKMGNVVTDVFKQIDAMRQYWNSVTGDALYAVGSEVDHLSRPFQTAHLLTEYLNRAIPLPDPRMLRRVVSATHAEGRFLQRMLHFGIPLDKFNAIERGAITTRIMDTTVQKVWKPIVLLRGAWTARVIGEEQLRMGAAGLESMFRHPFQYMAWVAEKQRFGGKFMPKGGQVTIKRLTKTQAPSTVNQYGKIVPGKTQYKVVDEVIDVARGDKDIMGSILHEHHRHTSAMSSRNAGWLDVPPGDMFKSAWVPVRKHQAGFRNGWVRSLGQLWNDEITSFILTHGVDDAFDWFSTGAGRKLRERLMQSGGPEKKMLLNTDAGMRGYLESVQARAHQYAGGRVTGPATKDEWLAGVGYEITEAGNPEIIKLIADGMYDGKNLRAVQSADDWDNVLDMLGHFADDLPEDFITKAPMIDPRRAAQQDKLWDTMTGFGFEWLMTRPTNKLSRSPAFRQFYWTRMEEMLTYMDDGVAAAVIKAGKEAGLSRAQLNRMAKRRTNRAELSAKQAGMEDLTFNMNSGMTLKEVMGEADEIAKYYALNETERLLYTLNKKHAINDVLRNVIPFGEAWYEIMSTWGRLVTEHPQIIRRGQQFIEGARDSGYLERDPVSGEDVFNFPGAGTFNRILFGEGAEEAGARVNPIGFVSGLNLAAGSYHPGLGPIIQVPTAWGLAGKEEWDWLVKFSNPFGVKEIDSPGDVLNQSMPAWFQKLMSAAGGGAGTESWRTMQESTAIDIARVLAYSGQYDMNNPDDVEKIRDKAQSSARWFSLIRGAIQFGAPTGASLRYEVETAGEDGRFFGIGVLRDEYSAAMDRFDGDEGKALAWFMEAFGLNPVALVTSKTRTVTPHHMTEEGSAWARGNKKLLEDYPNTGYYISPDEAEDEFDWGAWNQSLASGAREQLSVDDWVSKVNDTKGRLIYENQRQKLEGMEVLHEDWARSYLRDLRAYLMENYDGYKKTIVGSAQQATRDEKIAELRTMIDDPRLGNYPAVQGLAVWFGEWDKVSEAYVAGGGGSPDGWLQSNSGQGLRRYMRDLAQHLMKQEEYSGFNAVWQSIFKRMMEDEEVTPVDLSMLGM